ncbi:MAG: hypothetical protein CM1200mP30_26860 [Pseudomonadota bacterium]|nr:MAG: hypothetical protein CM1200mP30_26860 [Pseudomonadota bacterium]
MNEYSAKRVKKTLLLNMILLAVLPYSLFAEEQMWIIRQQPCVMFLQPVWNANYTHGCRRKWQILGLIVKFQSHVTFATMYIDILWTTVLGLTRGIQNLTNRKRLAAILEEKDFLTVIVRQSGEAISVEAAMHNLKQEEPLWAKVFEWSKPWALW